VGRAVDQCRQQGEPDVAATGAGATSSRATVAAERELAAIPFAGPSPVVLPVFVLPVFVLMMLVLRTMSHQLLLS
jgi:hypothetical protein